MSTDEPPTPDTATDTPSDDRETFRPVSDETPNPHPRSLVDHPGVSADDLSRSQWKVLCGRCNGLVPATARFCEHCRLGFPGGLGTEGWTADGSDLDG